MQLGPRRTVPAVARAAVEAERLRARHRAAAARCAAVGGEENFTEFGRLLRHDCFHQDVAGQCVRAVQRGALEPWYQRAGSDGSRLVPWLRGFGIARSGSGGG
eukprot:8109545-Pyramimonas_sp.AAC.1